MVNFEFLRKYQKLQYTIMFDRFTELDFAIVAFCDEDKSPFWNYTLTDHVLSEKELLKIEEIMVSSNRKSAVYFENKQELQSLKELLETEGYKKEYEDSWMFWAGGELDSSRFSLVKKVTNSEELKLFLETFNNCYQKNDPQNVYGELGDYLKVSEKVWKKHSRRNRLEYFMIYKGDKPVAVSTLTNHDGIGYISNVGSLREVRGEGFGKIASLYPVSQSIKNGNLEHCLATEEGTYPNEFYKRIGFETRFTAVCYVKQ